MFGKTASGVNKAAKGHVYVQWMVAILANMTLITYGLQSGWVSPMAKYLQSEQSPTGTPVSDIEMSWIASTMCLSAVFGVPLFTYIADRFGRKIAVIGIAVPQSLCWILKFSSANTTVLIAARICCGLSSGGCFNVIPIYVKEISQDSIRGLLGSLLIVFQNIGVLAMYALGAYLEYYTVLWVVFTLPIATMTLMFKAPESPAFLVKTGRFDEATATIAFLRGLQEDNKEVQNEIECMKREDLDFKSLPDISFKSIYKNKAWRRSFIGACLLMIVSAGNGCFAIMTYASTILSSSGVTISPELQSLSFPIVMILSGFASMSCVDRYGRKPILIASQIFVAVSMVGLASIILVQEKGGYVPGWLSVTCMVVAVSGYAGGIAPVPYIMMSEMFSFQVRAKITGVIVMIGWFVTFLTLLVFAPLSNAFGMYTMFYGFSVVNLLAVAVTLVLLPETMGKSVEEIETELRTK